jgi:hypothetical protein
MKEIYNCTNKYCYITGEILSPTETTEHIIPNALGGHLKSNKLVLSRINTGLFDRLDAVLAKRMEISFLFDFKRDYGKKPEIKVTAENGFSYWIHNSTNIRMASMKPFEIKNEKGEIFEKFPLHQKEEIIADRLKRHPHLTREDVENSITKEKLKPPTVFFENNLNVIHNSVDSFRAIAKIATNFAILNNVEKSFTNLIDFITGKIGLEHVNLGYYYPKQFLLYDFDEKEVSHILYLKGSKNERLLYCYIELFNLHCFIVILNYNYWGENFIKSYVWDVRRREVLKKDIALNLTKYDIKPPFCPYHIDTEKDYTERLFRLSPILDLKIKKK